MEKMNTLRFTLTGYRNNQFVGAIEAERLRTVLKASRGFIYAEEPDEIIVCDAVYGTLSFVTVMPGSGFALRYSDILAGFRCGDVLEIGGRF